MFFPSTANLLICSGLLLISVLAYWSLLPSRSSVDPSMSTHHHHGAEALVSESLTDGGMQMWFYNSMSVTLWFQQWSTSTPFQYMLVLSGLVAFAVAHEGLACLRSHWVTKTCKAHDDGSNSARSHPKASGKDKLVLATLYFLNIISGYLLMLAVMTYNAGCFLAVGLGLALGYFLFFDKQSNPSALLRSDSCHVRLLDGE